MSVSPRLFHGLLGALALASTSVALADTLEFDDKWGNSFFRTFGPITSTPGAHLFPYRLTVLTRTGRGQARNYAWRSELLRRA